MRYPLLVAGAIAAATLAAGLMAAGVYPLAQVSVCVANGLPVTGEATFANDVERCADMLGGMRFWGVVIAAIAAAAAVNLFNRRGTPRGVSAGAAQAHGRAFSRAVGAGVWGAIAAALWAARQDAAVLTAEGDRYVGWAILGLAAICGLHLAGIVVALLRAGVSGTIAGIGRPPGPPSA